jgi:eukaryotic-like serine/threonine-protein kinase
MDSGQWIKIKETFSAVAELPLDERSAFLRRSDPLIRDEVEKLLAASESAGDFIASPIHVGNGHSNFADEAMIGREIDDYVILEKLGEGGMGTVYLAEHRSEEFSQRVALKLIKRGMDTNAVLKRFFIERQILASLEHPNIARLLDGGSTEDGLPYFVMELVEGESIKNFCDGHQYETNERLQLFQKVCHAISYAHQKLIVHRDIKPSNIVVTESSEPKLLDFGIAKLLSPDWDASTGEATATNFRLMTPEYASPEQLRGQMTTTATDVYSLGVVLYELLTGARPYKFTSKDPFEISHEILTIEPLRPSSVVSSVFQVQSSKSKNRTDENNGRTQSETANPKSKFRNPKSLKGDLDNIILKAIQKDPKDRYKSVEDLAEDIGRYLNGLPVRATADSLTYRFKKFVTRNRVGSAVAALILFLSGVAGWQAVVANQAREKADDHVRQVRDVAKSLLNDTSQTLQNLPDGLEVRQQIVEKSASVLDSLSADVDDVEFLSELGTAYQQLGWSRVWHLRDYEKALSDLQKARKLHERVVELEPDNPEHLLKLVLTLGAFSEFYGIQGNTEAVAENYQTVIEINVKQFALEPNNPNIFFAASNTFDDWSNILKA